MVFIRPCCEVGRAPLSPEEAAAVRKQKAGHFRLTDIDCFPHTTLGKRGRTEGGVRASLALEATTTVSMSIGIKGVKIRDQGILCIMSKGPYLGDQVIV